MYGTTEKRMGQYPGRTITESEGLKDWKRDVYIQIGETGLEPATSASQKQRSSQLNYSPT